MLLDRKRINRWTRWFAIIMAIIFALSGIFFGVGSYVGGNLLAGCAKSTPSANSTSFEDREAYYLDQINQNPKDTDSMSELAALYANDSVGRYDDAISWMNQAIAIAPTNVTYLQQLSALYAKTQKYDDGIKVFVQLTTQDPNNAGAFLQLGSLYKAAGQNANAILAWNRYLQLAPNSPYASELQQEIAQLATLPAVTPTTSTVPGTQGITVPSTPPLP